MVVMVVTCDTCNTDKIYKDKCYRLEVEWYGKPVTCDKCKHTKTPHHIHNFTFCSRKCLMEFLEKYKNENYIHSWEEQNVL